MVTTSSSYGEGLSFSPYEKVFLAFPVARRRPAGPLRSPGHRPCVAKPSAEKSVVLSFHWDGKLSPPLFFLSLTLCLLLGSPSKYTQNCITPPPPTFFFDDEIDGLLVIRYDQE